MAPDRRGFHTTYLLSSHSDVLWLYNYTPRRRYLFPFSSAFSRILPRRETSNELSPLTQDGERRMYPGRGTLQFAQGGERRALNPGHVQPT